VFANESLCFRNNRMNCKDAFHAVFLLCNGQNIAEYKAYWLMYFPIIIP